MILSGHAPKNSGTFFINKFTEIDYLSQKLFTNIIQKFYPYKNFTIIGEEALNEENDKKILDLNNKDKLEKLYKLLIDKKVLLQKDITKVIEEK